MVIREFYFKNFVPGFPDNSSEDPHYRGTPVMASHISAIPEVTGAAALLVDPHNVNEIAAQMYQITHDQLLRETLIKKGFLRKKQN